MERIRAFAAGLEPELELLERHLIEVADDMERDIRVRVFAEAEAALVG